MSTERFLEILDEEMDKMVRDQGLILTEKFRDAMHARLMLEEEKNSGFFY
jgi:hypothetical protein